MSKLLLKSGIVVTQDAKLGVLPKGDVLVEGDKISAIGPSLLAPDAETVDCSGHFVLPGLINAHMHTWQTALRSVAANWTLLEYFRKTTGMTVEPPEGDGKSITQIIEEIWQNRDRAYNTRRLVKRLQLRPCPFKLRGELRRCHVVARAP